MGHLVKDGPQDFLHFYTFSSEFLVFLLSVSIRYFGFTNDPDGNKRRIEDSGPSQCHYLPHFGKLPFGFLITDRVETKTDKRGLQMDKRKYHWRLLGSPCYGYRVTK